MLFNEYKITSLIDSVLHQRSLCNNKPLSIQEVDTILYNFTCAYDIEETSEEYSEYKKIALFYNEIQF